MTYSHVSSAAARDSLIQLDPDHVSLHIQVSHDVSYTEKSGSAIYRHVRKCHIQACQEVPYTGKSGSAIYRHVRKCHI